MHQVRVVLGNKLLKNYAIPSTSTSSYHTHLQLRESFYEYFKSKNHEIQKSASVVPNENDGTLLFTNAGMNQFKSVIVSSTEPLRVANIQKCIRAGGKHNDLDDVGKDLHHQTFFEMMGNWSFNDAFSKEEACRFAWEYLVDVLRIDADRLYVSYFGGIENLGLPEDHECREIWQRIGVPSHRILPFVAENFWEMGATGPCGPCTEIHYDRIGARDASRLVNIDDSVVEIWNIVFMSNLRDSSGRVQSLGKNHIDTGMGFERLLSVVQNKKSNFDTDMFTPILNRIAKLTDNNHNYKGTLSSPQDAVFRLIADHVRASTVAISDGVHPDNSGSGFVVRKMMRRAFLQGTTKLGIDRYALSDLVPTVISTLKDVYPEINNSSESVVKLFKEEENQFWKTVDRAKKVFDSVVAESKSNVLTGSQVFDLFETYGLPLSVTVELARNIGREVDEQGFEKYQLAAQDLSKRASQFNMPISVHDFPTHSDQAKYEYTVENGDYVFPQVSSRVLEVYQDQKKVDRLNPNESGYIVLEDCQFYAEQGGQATDCGILLIGDTEAFQVESAKKVAGGAVTVLYGRASQPIQKDVRVEQRLDEKRRRELMRAHSATHLLNWALQKSRLGCGQKGSSVDCDRLRFDYSTGEEAVTKEMRMELLRKCESLMADFIRKGGRTRVDETTIEEAKKMENMQSDVKEDKIGKSSVRVVSLGEGTDIPIECCSGTHVHDVSAIGDVAIISDKSIGQGTRRVIAVCGEEAKECRKYVRMIEDELAEKEKKERAGVAKKINWKRVPMLDVPRISKLIKAKK